MEERHCIRCGEVIPEGSEYCPTCGASLDGTAYDRTADFYRNKAGWKKEDTLQSIPKLMMVYGVLAVIVGAVVLVSYGTIDGTWEQLADADGTYYGLTLDQTRSALMFIGIPMALSGLCALASGFMTGKREGYRMSMLLCILASVLPLFMALGLLNTIVFGIVLCVIGLYVTTRLYNNSQCFAS